MTSQRKIIHVDMDAFFASVEQRDNPELKGKPVIVGGTPNSRGVVAACSYEARQFGIHSAMPSSRAYRLCPHAVFVKPRFEAYRESSQQIKAVFKHYTELIEPLSLDEAYLDVTGSEQCQGSATLIAKDIKKAILAATDLTASAGVSHNKFLAKLASDMDKPDGLFVIKPGRETAILEPLAVRKFHGIGKATETKMQAMGIYTGLDLKNYDRDLLIQRFGKAGHYFSNIAHGIDERPVQAHRIRKSVGAERTYANDLTTLDAVNEQLSNVSDMALQRLDSVNQGARTVTLKVRYDDFTIITRSASPDDTVFNGVSNDELYSVLQSLLQRTDAGKRGIRLLGVSFSNLLLEAHRSDQASTVGNADSVKPNIPKGIQRQFKLPIY